MLSAWKKWITVKGFRPSTSKPRKPSFWQNVIQTPETQGVFKHVVHFWVLQKNAVIFLCFAVSKFTTFPERHRFHRVKEQRCNKLLRPTYLKICNAGNCWLKDHSKTALLFSRNSKRLSSSLQFHFTSLYEIMLNGKIALNRCNNCTQERAKYLLGS